MRGMRMMSAIPFLCIAIGIQSCSNAEMSKPAIPDELGVSDTWVAVNGFGSFILNEDGTGVILHGEDKETPLVWKSDGSSVEITSDSKTKRFYKVSVDSADGVTVDFLSPTKDASSPLGNCLLRAAIPEPDDYERPVREY